MLLKDLIKKIEAWKDYSERIPYSGLKESTIYGRVLRELYEVQDSSADKALSKLDKYLKDYDGVTEFSEGVIAGITLAKAVIEEEFAVNEK